MTNVGSEAVVYSVKWEGTIETPCFDSIPARNKRVGSRFDAVDFDRKRFDRSLQRR